MGEVKRYYMMKSAVTPMADGAPCYTPLVNSKTDLHIVPLVLGSDYDALHAENAELVAALIEAQKIINHQGWSANEQPAYDAIEAALAKHRGGTTQPTDKP